MDKKLLFYKIPSSLIEIFKTWAMSLILFLFFSFHALKDVLLLSFFHCPESMLNIFRERE
jgi:hypothetical protein